MNRLIRMAYGHGGTRLEKVLVAVPAAEPVEPRWLRPLFLAIWLTVPILICRFSLPTPTHTATVIDTSRMTIQPAPEIPLPERREMPAPPPLPVATKTAPAPKTPEEPTPAAIDRPTIARPAPATETPDYQPRIARKRVQPGEERRLPPETRIRRDLPATRASSEPTAITRTRGVVATDLPAAPERRAAMRRSVAAEDTGRETTTTLRQVTRRERPADCPAAAPRVAAVRERRETGGTGGGEPAGEVGLARGVSLASLEICASPQAEEDAIRAVLGAVGSRRSCRDATGEYQFTGTRRVSSFNLMIRPAKGRRATNRCEELQNAYTCLTSH